MDKLTFVEYLSLISLPINWLLFIDNLLTDWQLMTVSLLTGSLLLINNQVTDRLLDNEAHVGRLIGP